jgi:hypothetical protein
MAMSKPVADVLGCIQTFESVFIEKAPCRNGQRELPWLTIDLATVEVSHTYGRMQEAGSSIPPRSVPHEQNG